MKVALLTLYGHLQSTNSLVNVAAVHLQMLLDAGIKTKMLVSEHCPDNQRQGIFLDDRIEWLKVRNTFCGKMIEWHNYGEPYGNVHETFFEEAEVIAEDLVNKLSDVNVCIVHDILYHSIHLVNNVALRKAQEQLPGLKFISFSHSAPICPPYKPEYPFSTRFTPMPNTKYVTFTHALIPDLAKQYGVAEGRCFVVNNNLDLLQYMSDDIKSLASRVDLFSPDVLITYPARFVPEKKFEKIAAFAGAIKTSTHKNVKVIFCDIPINSNHEEYKHIVQEEGCKNGLNKQDMVFTTDLGYQNGFPRNSILELFTLSNLFISPSISEAFQLTVIEAASRGNFIVLNRNLPALEELGKHLRAYFLPWDALLTGTYIKENYVPSEQEFFQAHAIEIINQMMSNPVLYAKTITRQRFSTKWVWDNQLAPLLED